MGFFRKTRSKSCGAPERMEAETAVLTGRLESSESAQSQLRLGGLSWLSASSGQQRPPSLCEDADTATARCCPAHIEASHVPRRCPPCWIPLDCVPEVQREQRHRTDALRSPRRLGPISVGLRYHTRAAQASAAL